MRIYFAGSIRGGRDDAGLYLELVEILQQHGQVLTEHVATVGEEDMADADIFTRDLDWLTGSDVVVAEVTTPSLGVGYEIAFAVERGIPVLCLFRPGEGRQVSAMLSGNSSVGIVNYRDVAETTSDIARFIAAADV